ncbi:hypothetical protein QYE76_024096 [Lolium multiflorum]|uniref:RNase H type-1 domain-containing protein n=1 Tax=Lolium multiflorum TaxID=4521 RepID=A0AAD8REG2_LOLMU|nr:hypothetical protein QYE76_024096 [Lolium multiflorum]
MNFDGSKRVEGAGAGVILISPEGDKLKYVLRMTFPNASNNEAEYEALIHGMKMAKACGATRLKIFGDSQLVAQQVMNQCDAVNDSMVAYKEVYNELEKLFDVCDVNHISRLSNDEADVLANIGSQCLAIPPGVFWEEIAERSTKPKKAHKKEKEEKTSAPPKEALEEEEDQELVMMVEVPWMQAQLSSYKTMNTRGISKLFHQAKKSIGSFISREHNFVNKGQGSSAEIKDIANLIGAVLKPDNLSGPLWSGPEQIAVVKRKVNEEIHPFIHPFIFSNNVEK